MRTRPILLIFALLVGLLLVAAPSSSAQTSSAQTSDSVWATVDKVLVDRLGGVSVEGRVDCSATYHQLVSTGYWVWTQTGPGQYTQVHVQAQPNDYVAILINPDQYTVSQPVGRKGTIQVTHESSRATPCFTNATPAVLQASGYGNPSCSANGSPCAWKTDQFGWGGPGPLFDYSPNGKFSRSLLAVDGHTSTTYATIWSASSGYTQSTEWDLGNDANFSVYHVTIKPVAYR